MARFVASNKSIAFKFVFAISHQSQIASHQRFFYIIILIPPANMMRANIALTTFGGINLSAKDPKMPPKTTPAPTVNKGTDCKLPLKTYTSALTKEIGRITTIAVA